MQFDSPRFQGDALLEEILNDPDTGTRKLQHGSPADSVRPVQQALYDLNWSLKIGTPVTDEETFVDGDYGPATTETVLTYKTHYDIHFPPDVPTGSFDGFTGPRTLRALDAQCVLLDESAAAIEQHAAELTQAGVQMQLTSARPQDTPILGTHGVYRVGTIDGAGGAVFHRADLGAFEVHGRIADEYAAHGGATGSLGFPTSDEHEDGEGYRRSDFEQGSLRCNLSTGVVEVIQDTQIAEP